ncbi:MAG: hypothetical protein ACR2PK_02095 [Acidimicrobiales bacterium]
MTTTAPPLATGWEPGAAEGDTMTRRFLFHLARTYEAFAEAAGGRVQRDPMMAASDLRRPSGFFNSIILLQPVTPTNEAEVVDRIARFVAGGTGEVEVWSLWPLPDMAIHGWELIGHPPLLVRPPNTPLEELGSSIPDITRVESADGLADWDRVAIEGFPLPEAEASSRLADPKLLNDPRLKFWVGYENGVAVSLGTVFVEDDLASFTLGVTRPEARGRGHWQAHARARLAAAPDRWMTGVFSDFSRPLAEAIGFVPITRFNLWAIPRG